jgi:hypothetical protein
LLCLFFNAAVDVSLILGQFNAALKTLATTMRTRKGWPADSEGHPPLR